MKKVMAFGTFDKVHPGHVDYLEQAKACGDILIVCVARDTNVFALKGAMPDHSEEERRSMVEQLKIADKVMIGDNTDLFRCIREEKPDIICLGYDQKVPFDLEYELVAHKMSTKILRAKPYKEDIYKSSLIAKR
ncbi:FAD synthase [Candidatus Woesearchaeota archaeon]|nr:FAD synthase [Candidatus Woesearchaeota archaeon]